VKVVALPAGCCSPASPLSCCWPASRASQRARPIFVLNSLDADVSIIDPATYTVVRRLPTGKEPHHLYLAPDEKTLIVANAAATR
jgi:YVTN family beta-propeller protein